MKKVVVIGGGTGTSVVLSSLKVLKDIDLSAIVSVADSGGSTGRLRDEFGFQPVGDLRQALSAFAEVDVVIINNGKIPLKILTVYKKQHEYPVFDDLKELWSKRIIRVNLIRSTLVKQNQIDAVHRSYLRHDPLKLRLVLNKII